MLPSLRSAASFGLCGGTLVVASYAQVPCATVSYRQFGIRRSHRATLTLALRVCVILIFLDLPHASAQSKTGMVATPPICRWDFTSTSGAFTTQLESSTTAAS